MGCCPLVGREVFATGLQKWPASTSACTHPHLHEQWVNVRTLRERQTCVHTTGANGAACTRVLAGHSQNHPPPVSKARNVGDLCLRRSLLGPVLFDLFIKDLDLEVSSMLATFADHTIIRGKN